MSHSWVSSCLHGFMALNMLHKGQHAGMQDQYRQDVLHMQTTTHSCYVRHACLPRIPEATFWISYHIW